MSILSGLGGLVKAVSKTVDTVVKAEQKAMDKAVSAIIPTKAKVTNVVDVYKSVLTGKGATANIPGTTGKIVSSAASNPFTTALAVTPLNTLSAAKAGFTALSTGQKVLAVSSVPVVASVAISNPKVISSAGKVPSSVANFAGNVAQFSSNPSWDSAKEIISENPIVSGAVAFGAATIVGGGILGAVNTAINTSAIRSNTKATEKAIASLTDSTLPAVSNSILTASEGLPKALSGTSAASGIPITPSTQIIGKSAGVARKNQRKKNSLTTSALRQVMRVTINNQGKHLYTNRTNCY